MDHETKQQMVKSLLDNAIAIDQTVGGWGFCISEDLLSIAKDLNEEFKTGCNIEEYEAAHEREVELFERSVAPQIDDPDPSER